MAYPGYQPLAVQPLQQGTGGSVLSPQQQQAYMQLLRQASAGQQQPGQLTYEQFLAMKGLTPQGQAAGQPQQSGGLDFNNILKSLGEDKAKSAATTAVTSAAPTVAAPVASSGAFLPGGTGIGYGGLSAETPVASAVTASGEPGVMMASANPALSGSVVGSEAAAGPWSLSGFGSAGNFYAPAAGALLAYDVLNSRRGGWGGAAEGALSGAGIGSYFGPWGAGIGALIGGGVGYFDKHKTTRQVAAENTKDMQSRFTDDPNYQAYVSGMRQQYNAPPPDPKNPFFGGKYATFDAYKKAGLDAQDLSGVRGNIDTFGNDWSSLSQDQRNKVTQGLIDANLYTPSKGEVNITDANRAKQIYDSTINGPAASANPIMIPRTGRKGAGYGTSNYQR